MNILNKKNKIIAIPFAGGNRFSFKILEKYVPQDFDWITLESPGRGNRFSEKLLDNIDETGDFVEQIQYSPEQEALAERDALSDMFGDTPLTSEESDVFDGSLGFLGHLPAEGMNLKDKLTEFEIEMIRQALDSQDGVVSHAAELLSMRRTTLVEKIKKYGLNKEG